MYKCIYNVNLFSINLKATLICSRFLYEERAERIKNLPMVPQRINSEVELEGGSVRLQSALGH